MICLMNCSLVVYDLRLLVIRASEHSDKSPSELSAEHGVYEWVDS